jgi:hypothetical protein
LLWEAALGPQLLAEPDPVLYFLYYSLTDIRLPTVSLFLKGGRRVRVIIDFWACFLYGTADKTTDWARLLKHEFSRSRF